MSASVNKAILVGRLGKEPEIRYTSGGQAVASFSLATDESYKNREGEKVKKTEWMNIVVWGNSVEAFIKPYIHKGCLVYVEGKLQTRSWDDKNGQKKYTTEINVADIKLLANGNDSGSSKPASGGAAHEPEIADEDIPF